MQNIKGKLGLVRKITSTKRGSSGPKKTRVASQEKVHMQSQGRQLVKCAIAHMSNEGASNPQPSSGSIGHTKELEPQEDHPKEQGEKQKRKQRMQLEVKKEKQKRQKKDISPISLQLAIVPLISSIATQ